MFYWTFYILEVMTQRYLLFKWFPFSPGKFLQLASVFSVPIVLSPEYLSTLKIVSVLI